MSAYISQTVTIAESPKAGLNTAGKAPFATVDLDERGSSYLVIRTPEEGRALIAAIASAVALLEAATKPSEPVMCPSCHSRGGHTLRCSCKPPCPAEGEPHAFVRPGQVAPEFPPPDNCMVCGAAEAAHKPARPDNSFVPVEQAGERCHARCCAGDDLSWHCLALKDHTGPHMAYGNDGKAHHSWPQETLNPLDEWPQPDAEAVR